MKKRSLTQFQTIFLWLHACLSVAIGCMSVRGVPSSNPQSQSVLAVTLLVYQATALVIFNYCFVDIMVYTVKPSYNEPLQSKTT